MPDHNTLRQKFDLFRHRREAKLTRAREHAAATIPSLLPREGMAQDSELDIPYNSLPTAGLNALAARVTSVLVPINGLPPAEFVPKQHFESVVELDSPVLQSLRRLEHIVTEELGPTNFRAKVFEAILHLLVVGDVLIWMTDDFRFRLFRLDQYIVRRDGIGDWKEIIIKEHVEPDLLPDEIKNLAPDKVKTEAPKSHTGQHTKEYIYTRIWIDDDDRDRPYKMEREYHGKKFDTNVDFRTAPVYPLRWNTIDGEDYGRSFVEESFGDINFLDVMTKNLMDGGILNSQFRWGLDPSGVTEPDDWNQSENGDAIPARAGEIFPIQAANHSQVAAALESVRDIRQALARRFLMQSVQRDAERVTAAEIRTVAQELEQSLGGVMSHFSTDIIAPIFLHTLDLMAEEDRIPQELLGFVIGTEEQDNVLVIRARAGLETLNREAEMERIMQLVQLAPNLPEEAQSAIRWTSVLRRLANNLGFDGNTAVKSEEEIAQEQAAIQQQQQAQQQSEMAQQATLEAAKQQDQAAAQQQQAQPPQ